MSYEWCSTQSIDLNKHFYLQGLGAKARLGHIKGEQKGFGEQIRILVSDLFVVRILNISIHINILCTASIGYERILRPDPRNVQRLTSLV